MKPWSLFLCALGCTNPTNAYTFQESWVSALEVCNHSPNEARLCAISEGYAVTTDGTPEDCTTLAPEECGYVLRDPRTTLPSMPTNGKEFIIQ